uniref:Uncharacterized protein n=1 Tax=Meloidogyne hapla TaxID=6305 RepID=A0A1I8B776_MELHA
MVISGPPQSPRTGLALTDLQQSPSGSLIENISNNNGNNNNNLNGSCSISGGLISGLTIASNGGSGNWSTRGVGGIGAGLSCSSVSQSPFHVGGGLFGGNVGLQINGSFGQNGGSGGSSGLFNNCGCSSSDYGLFKK